MDWWSFIPDEFLKIYPWLGFGMLGARVALAQWGALLRLPGSGPGTAFERWPSDQGVDLALSSGFGVLFAALTLPGLREALIQEQASPA